MQPPHWRPPPPAGPPQGGPPAYGPPPGTPPPGYGPGGAPPGYAPPPQVPLRPYGPPPNFQPAFYPNGAAAPWMQPGPPRPLPPRKKGGAAGCLVGAIVTSVVVGIPLLLVLVLVGSSESGPTDPIATNKPVSTNKPIGTNKPVTTDPTELAWKYGTCNDYTKERNYPDYAVKRNHGSAHALVGRVLLLHLRMKGPQFNWSAAQTRTVENAMVLAERYYETMAKADGQNLDVDSVAWDLNAMFTPTPFSLDSHHLMTVEGMRRYRDEARTAAEVALKQSLSSLVRNAGTSKGYDEVAIFVHIPMETQARDFAFAALATDPKNYAETAFIFVPRSRDFGNFSVTIAHEGLHLFGADDLYRIRDIPLDEKKDVMNAYCTGFGEAKMLEATKYGIGWRAVPPVRPYRFTEW